MWALLDLYIIVFEVKNIFCRMLGLCVIVFEVKNIFCRMLGLCVHCWIYILWFLK